MNDWEDIIAVFGECGYCDVAVAAALGALEQGRSARFAFDVLERVQEQARPAASLEADLFAAALSRVREHQPAYVEVNRGAH